MLRPPWDGEFTAAFGPFRPVPRQSLLTVGRSLTLSGHFAYASGLATTGGKQTDPGRRPITAGDAKDFVSLVDPIKMVEMLTSGVSARCELTVGSAKQLSPASQGRGPETGRALGAYVRDDRDGSPTADAERRQLTVKFWDRLRFPAGSIPRAWPAVSATQLATRVAARGGANQQRAKTATPPRQPDDRDAQLKVCNSIFSPPSDCRLKICVASPPHG
jgi:hypothetical protein